MPRAIIRDYINPIDDDDDEGFLPPATHRYRFDVGKAVRLRNDYQTQLARLSIEIYKVLVDQDQYSPGIELVGLCLSQAREILEGSMVMAVEAVPMPERPAKEAK